MRKLALTAALIASLPTAAMAVDWVFIGETVRGDKYYIERDSIRTMPNGNKRAWVRNEYKEADKWGDTSNKILREYDCRDGRSRYLQMTYFKGEEVTTIDNETREWTYVEPDSASEAMLNFVCFGRLP